MNDLGRLEDLPADYVAALRERNLVPLWPSLRGVLPPQIPTRQTKPTHWAYADIKPLLLKAGELTPIEKAERRVLVLANPGHTLEKMQASAALYLGMQLLLPGEWAPSHRHTPNAVRMVVEGEGAWTTVDGEKCPMSRGDLILTPTGRWHEHGHDGDQPVVWLDVLDLPLMYYLEVSYHLNGGRQAVKPGRGDRAYSRAGVVPTPVFGRAGQRYPMLRYPWADAKAALLSIAEDRADLQHVQVTYTNPETGEDAENVLGFHALMLRPGQTLALPARSPACVYHAIEGRARVSVQGHDFDLKEADTCCIPGYTPTTLVNASASEPAFLFVADESPLHRKLGVYEVRPDNQPQMP
ncbi:cupin domain-containing protein [Hydrogenophaga sp. YM1]|uniref:cupin domain-containing protein n=1 Tax=Hydrogenophaga TaxID=47420 RepID=UPI00086B0DF9|nr:MULTISPECIES: cupin domain-containing protein [unclassified Hydrogenophaga]MBN9372662.1 cupin domain-containing protein [Hydrogenophaga sp.]ODT33260.1 MAG: cupin [Hydrogenophaga sp. SCN 70-13]OJV54547.1 MAG: cupin [Hydrogenophaga sp. 70-12]QRR34202.1 cupin domain-containing protein [Hydrogenophaga sp. YM1]